VLDGGNEVRFVRKDDQPNAVGNLTGQFQFVSFDADGIHAGLVQRPKRGFTYVRRGIGFQFDGKSVPNQAAILPNGVSESDPDTNDLDFVFMLP
jgi:hypothetical protein